MSKANENDKSSNSEQAVKPNQARYAGLTIVGLPESIDSCTLGPESDVFRQG